MNAVAVDPRIRARRVSVARDAGRRRLRVVLLAVAVLAVAGAVLAVTWTPLLDVERIEVRGATRTSSVDVTDAAGIAVGDPLVWFDLAAAERAVASLPWIGDVAVDRSWSGSVTVVVTERVPVASLATADGGWVLADGEGRVLAAVDAEPTQVATVEGVTTSATPGSQLAPDVLDALAVAAAAPPGIRADLAAVRGAGPDVELELRAGGVIQLGGIEDAGAKLAAAAAVLATVTPGCVEQLDVALPAAPALVRVDGCS